jgi:hypothetical protein
MDLAPVCAWKAAFPGFAESSRIPLDRASSRRGFPIRHGVSLPHSELKINGDGPTW